MRVAVVWRDNTDYAREVTEWMSEFSRETGREVESIDPDTVDGEIFVRARDIMQFPTVLALTDDGVVLTEWRGKPLPQFSDVLYRVREM